MEKVTTEIRIWQKLSLDVFRFPYPRSEICSDERGVRIGHLFSVSDSFQKYQ